MHIDEKQIERLLELKTLELKILLSRDVKASRPNHSASASASLFLASASCPAGLVNITAFVYNFQITCTGIAILIS